MLVEDADEGESVIDPNREKVVAQSRGKAGARSLLFGFGKGSNKAKPGAKQVPTKTEPKVSKTQSDFSLPRLVKGNTGRPIAQINRSKVPLVTNLPDLEQEVQPVQKSTIEPIPSHAKTGSQDSKVHKSISFNVPLSTNEKTSSNEIKNEETSSRRDSKTPLPRSHSRAKSRNGQYLAPSSLAIPDVKPVEVREPVGKKHSDASPRKSIETQTEILPETSPVLSPVHLLESVEKIPIKTKNNSQSAPNIHAIESSRRLDSTFAANKRLTVVPTTEHQPASARSQPQPFFAVPPRLLAGLSPSVSANALTVDIAIQLKTIAFGSPYRKPTDAWRFQSFAFSPENGPTSQTAPRFVIIQRPNTGSGTTGVLSVVQCELLRHVLFSKESKTHTHNEIPFNALRLLTRSERSEALGAALAEIIHKAATTPKMPFQKTKQNDEKPVAHVVIPCGRRVLPIDGSIADDGITEKLLMFTFSMKDSQSLMSELRSFFRQHLVHFDTDGSGGVLLLLYSAILSRGFEA